MGLLSWYAAVAASGSLLTALQVAPGTQGDPLDRLLDAIALVESRHNPAATGDNGRAVGVYQIHPAYWADGTRILGVDWDYRQARDPHKARQIVRAYLRHYGGGRPLLDLARIHNGGPRGHEKAATLAYARKIELALNQGEREVVPRHLLHVVASAAKQSPTPRRVAAARP